MEYKLLEEQDLELMLDFVDDENTKYNTLYTSSIGTITTHFLEGDLVLQIYYTTDTLLQVTYMKCDKKENSIDYIQGIKDIDWY